ncbi:MarR family winged helix-turn-helix transcriptional regulator [Falsibacillus pallidus]|uniref:MarR family winged helix-turn-helix transcriptional regulator n=1 Tax=Falsibacillus pallidus TaxID=493781 RepID=UPI003D99999E
MNNQQLKLENQICFKLYAAEREVNKIYRPILKELDITYPQYLVLLVLWETNAVSVKNLGSRLYLDSGTLTPMLKRMEQNGLIERNRFPEDERSVIISLTEKAKEMQKKAECIPDMLLKELSVSEEELKHLNGILLKLLR